MSKKGIKGILDFIIKLLSYICLVVLFLIAVFLIFYIVTNQVAKNKGENPLISVYTIVSESMVPTIDVYDIIIDTRVNDPSSLKEGDIITFRSNFIDTDGYTITHRIISIDNTSGETRYYTKGDHNSRQDEGYITFDNIVGKVVYIAPKIGKIQAFVSSKFGWLLIIFIPAVGIIIMDVFRLIKVYRIKNQIESIPRLKEVDKVREIEKNKKEIEKLESELKKNGER
ncbi:MAG: signal peptidase I [Bacilli bacterium]|nr:signal peptidase I [Bacilli bacterium]